MRIRNLSRSDRRRAFTILELLVATAITAVLATLLISITVSVMSVWNRSRGSLTTSNQVKLALDHLASDLEGAVFRHDGGLWLAATILETNNPAATVSDSHLTTVRQWVAFSGSGSIKVKPTSQGAGSDATGFVLNERSIDDCRFGRAGVWLRFFTMRLDSNADSFSLSAPTAVSYQLRRRRVSGGSSEIMYMLYRTTVRAGRSSGGAAGAFQTGFDLNNATYNTASSSEGNAGTIIRPTVTQVVANNVIDFGVRLYVRDNGGLRLIFPAQAATLGAIPATGVPSDSSAVVPAAELSHLAVTAGSADPADAYRTRMPDVVEVMIRVLSDEGAQRVQALEAGQAPGDWWTVALEHSTVYTRRIEIAGQAP